MVRQTIYESKDFGFIQSVYEQALSSEVSYLFDYICRFIKQSDQNNKQISIVLSAKAPTQYSSTGSLYFVSTKIMDSILTKALLVHELVHFAFNSVSLATNQELYDETMVSLNSAVHQLLGIDTELLPLFYLNSCVLHSPVSCYSESLISSIEAKFAISSCLVNFETIEQRGDRLLAEFLPKVVFDHHLGSQDVYFLERIADYNHGVEFGVYKSYGPKAYEEITARCIEMKSIDISVAELPCTSIESEFQRSLVGAISLNYAVVSHDVIYGN